MEGKPNATGGVVTTEPNATLDKITSWDRAQNPHLPELFTWLCHIYSQITPYGESLIEQYKRLDDPEQLEELLRKKLIKKGDYIHWKRMSATIELLINFQDAIQDATNVLQSEAARDIPDAFVQGVRIGILHETLTSVVDGRYQSLWLMKAARPSGGKATKELTSDADVLLLESTYAEFRGQTKEFQKTANELYSRHGIKGRRGGKISAKTIERRIKELLDSDNA